MEDDDEEPIRCPSCGSKHIHADQRGFNVLTGFVGSAKVVMTCLKCGRRFGPGEKQLVDWG
jgi:DNA-directed RNA polymerase subunit RPC12/RpoP